ncbi:hypothetical protein Tco_1174076 [Tanacetum coccineum]
MDKPRILLKERGAFGNADTVGAWLSLRDNLEEGDDDVKSHAPYARANTFYNGRDKGDPLSCEGELLHKTLHSVQISSAAHSPA